MNQSRETSPEQGLVESILADADAQVTSLLADAEAAARAALEQSEKEAAAIAEEVRAKTKLDADALTVQTSAKARVEVRRTLLGAREKAIADVLTRVGKTVQEIRGDAVRYRAAMTNLLTEAILGIGEDHVVVIVGADDKAMVNDSMMEAVKKGVTERSGLAVTVDLQFEDTDLGGGGIALVPGGRVRLDNTLPHRLKEAEHQLKSRIAAEIEKNCG